MKKLIYVLVLLMSMAPIAADWTQPHGDTRNSGVTSAVIGTAYRQQWEMPVRCISEPPIVARGRAYVLNDHREVEALDCRDGVTRWRFPLTGNWNVPRAGFGGRLLDPPSVVVAGDRVFASISTFYDGRLVALNADTGALVWEHRSTFTPVQGVSTRGAVLSAPIFWKDRLVFRTQNGLTALRLRDGKELWNALIDREGFDLSALSGHPAVGKDALYFGGDLGTAYAIRLQDGKRIWSCDTAGREKKKQKGLLRNHLVVGRCAPLLVGSRLFFADGKGNVYGVVAETGKKLWQSPCGGVWQLVRGGGVVYVVGSAGLVEMDPDSGKVLRRYSPPGGVWSCILSGGRAVLTHDAEEHPGIEVFDLRKWKTVWNDASVGVRSGFAVSENLLLAAGFVGAPDRSGLRKLALRAYAVEEPVR